MNFDIAIKDENFAQQFLNLIGADEFLSNLYYPTDTQSVRDSDLHFNGLLSYNDFLNFKIVNELKGNDINYLLRLAVLFLDFKNFNTFFEIVRCEFEFSISAFWTLIRIIHKLTQKNKKVVQVQKNIELIIKNFITFEQCIAHDFFKYKFFAKICDKIFNCYTHINNSKTNFEKYKIFDACEQLLEIHTLHTNTICSIFPSKEICTMLLQKFKDDYETNSQFYISNFKRKHSKDFTKIENLIERKNFKISDLNIEILNISESIKIKIEIKIVVVSNNNPEIVKTIKQSELLYNNNYYFFLTIIDAINKL